jgi:hypothetical protein
VVTLTPVERVPIAPLPTALPLFATGVAILGWLARPLKRGRMHSRDDVRPDGGAAPPRDQRRR